MYGKEAGTKNKQFHKCYYSERKCKATMIEKIVYII